MGDTFKKNKGYADAEGVKFQLDLVIVTSLNAFLHHKNWRVSSENRKAGKFDDVVVELSDGAGILIQAKHKKNERTGITKEQLLSTKRNAAFGLPKYFFSYEKIKLVLEEKIVIICTNACIDEKGIEDILICNRVVPESVLHYDSTSCSFYTFNENILPELKKSVVTYFNNNLQDNDADKAIITDENLKCFLKKLQIYSNYPSGEDLHKIIEELLSRCNNTRSWGKLTYENISKKVAEWFKLSTGEYLTELRTKAMFCEIKSDKYYQSLMDYHVAFKMNNFNFKESKRVFHIITEQDHLIQMLKIQHALREDKSKKLFVDPDDDDIEVYKHVTDAFRQRSYTFLIIVLNKNIKEHFLAQLAITLKEILEKYWYKKVILVAKRDNILIQQIGLKDIFQIEGLVTFEDLSEESREKLLKSESIVFQGEKISLEKLLIPQTSEYYIKSLDLTMLVEMVREKEVKVGNRLLNLNEDTARYYIRRTFEREFYATGKREDAIPEEALFSVNQKVILISDSAGTGKSTVLTKIAVYIKYKNSYLWVIRINLNDYTRILEVHLKNRKKINIIELLNSQDATKMSRKLEKFVFSMKEKVVLLLDGIDEISPDYTGLILDVLSQCQKTPNLAKIFITTRPHMTSRVEATLKIVSFTMIPFTRSNQIDFLTSYWTYNLQLSYKIEDKCKQYAETLIDTMSSWIKSYYYLENNFASIPLQVRMLAEIFQENSLWKQSKDWEGCKEYLEKDVTMPKLPEKFNMAGLYEMFIEKKRDVFMQKGQPGGNTVTNPALINQFDGCLAYHRSLALRAILKKHESDLFTNCHPSNQDLEQYVLKIGIVQKLGEEIQFIHRTYSEYFVAESILRELRLQQPNAEFQKLVIDKILLSDRYEVVCVFLDIFLQKIYLLPSILENYRCFKWDSNLDLIFQLARKGYVAILQFILKNINFKIIKGRKVEVGDWRIKITFMKRNTLNDLKILTRIAGVNIRNERGETPLHCAVKGGHLEMVRFLMEHGANVHVGDSNGSTPPHWAAVLGMLNIVKYFMEQCPDVKTMRDSEGRTALHLAAEYNRLNTVKYLIEHGAIIDAKDNESYTATHLAAKWGRLNTLKFLVEHGGDFNVRGAGECTAQHSAAKWDHFITLSYLVERGAAVNVKDSEKRTPLHHAAEYNRLKIVKYLVEHSADVNIVDNQGRTALGMAVERGNSTIVKYFNEISNLTVDDCLYRT